MKFGYKDKNVCLDFELMPYDLPVLVSVGVTLHSLVYGFGFDVFLKSLFII